MLKDLDLHPSYLEKDGKKEFVVLPYEEFVALQEFIEDAQDLFALRSAKESEGGEARVPLAAVEARLRQELGEDWDMVAQEEREGKEAS